MENLGLIEILFFYGIALGFGLWQWLKLRKDVKEIRAKRAAKEKAEKERQEAD